jgi:hypothetical protein
MIEHPIERARRLDLPECRQGRAERGAAAGLDRTGITTVGGVPGPGVDLVSSVHADQPLREVELIGGCQREMNGMGHGVHRAHSETMTPA